MSVFLAIDRILSVASGFMRDRKSRGAGVRRAWLVVNAGLQVHRNQGSQPRLRKLPSVMSGRSMRHTR